MARFLMGINYWPASSAMYAWERFDLDEIRNDMARIESLGFDLVRFFLSWEAFQPESNRMDHAALTHFVAMMDAIEDAGLLAMPTLFCGHMSGCNWLPRWVLSPDVPHGRFRTMTHGESSPYGAGDLYADQFLLDAQESLARRVGESVADHPALYCWDLGNEFSNVREPRTPDDAAAWSARLTLALAEASGAPSTGGMHGEDLERDRGIRPSSIAHPWEFASMHGYPVYSAFARNRRDPDVVPFLMQLEASCSGKAVLFTELGNPTCPPGTVSPYDRVPLPGEAPPAGNAPPNAAPYACLTEDEMADYAYAAIDRLHARGALGALWWCWADYAASLAHVPPFDRAPHEMHFGIVRADGTFKPVAHALQRIARQQRSVAAPPSYSPIAGEQDYYASLPRGIFTGYERYCAHYRD
ncbi:MAG TPA: beta-galactosidase [Candidatus Acidoferrales bacterium]|nr:beta-galactosidase [Candidatus Acidoferrales bacterium]